MVSYQFLAFYSFMLFTIYCLAIGTDKSLDGLTTVTVLHVSKTHVYIHLKGTMQRKEAFNLCKQSTV